MFIASLFFSSVTTPHPPPHSQTHTHTHTHTHTPAHCKTIYYHHSTNKNKHITGYNQMKYSENNQVH